MMSRSKVIWALSLLFLAILGGTSLTLYFFTGFGSYDLPPMARALGANKAAAEKAGIWRTWPETKSGMSFAQFESEVNLLNITLPNSDIENLSREQVRTERVALMTSVQDIDQLLSLGPVAWEPDVPFQTTSKLKGAAKLLAWEAVLAANEGDSDGVLKAIGNIRRLAALSAQSNQSTCVSVAIAIETISREAVVQVVYQRSQDLEMITSLQKICAKDIWTVDPGQLVRSEEFAMRVMMIRAAKTDPAWTSTDVFNAIEAIGNAPPARPHIVLHVPSRMITDALLSRHYEVYARLVTEADKGWDRLTAEAVEIDAETDAEGGMSRVFGHSLSNVHTALRRNHARTKILLAGLARVADPSSTLPADPYNEKSKLKVVAMPKGFLIYSVGRDQVDDGGLLKNNNDIGFEFKLKK